MNKGAKVNFPVFHLIVQYFFGFIIICLLLRWILSWISISESNPISRILTKITEPLIAPLRRIIPPLGMFDLSFMVAMFGIYILEELINQALPLSW